MSFAPGDEVVCINGRFNCNPQETAPKLGEHYIVRDVIGDGYYADGHDGLRLREIVNPPIYPNAECTFDATKFRPVRRESVDLFREMCVSTTKPLVIVD